MASATGRGDRRRRVFGDGRLAAEAAEPTEAAGPGRPAGTPRRYAPDAASASFAVARRVLPTGAAALASSAVLGTLALAGCAALHAYRATIAVTLGDAVTPLVDASSPTSLARLAAVAMALCVAAMCGVLLGLRRHRTDDVRGVYRWWATAGAASALAAVCLATNLHGVLAVVAAERIGWTALAGDAIWWLAPAVLLLAPVALRVFFDLRECRPAAVSAIAGSIAAAVALAAGLGWAPAAAQPQLDGVQSAATHATLLLTLLAQLLYARRIVLEAAGQVAAPATPKAGKRKANADGAAQTMPATQAAAGSPAKLKLAEETREPAAKTKRGAKAAAATQAKPEPAAPTQWVDGSQADYSDGYEDGEAPTRRRLSKAERKRIRKQKSRQNKAA
ncbi:MAG: hypothetical protein AAF790_08400 [Planctomycetota bacterium]